MTELTRAEKLLQAGIKRYGSLEGYKEELKQRGAKGGKTTGDSKRRGGKEYYSSIGKKGSAVRYGKDSDL